MLARSGIRWGLGLAMAALCVGSWAQSPEGLSAMSDSSKIAWISALSMMLLLNQFLGFLMVLSGSLRLLLVLALRRRSPAQPLLSIGSGVLLLMLPTVLISTLSVTDFSVSSMGSSLGLPASSGSSSAALPSLSSPMPPSAVIRSLESLPALMPSSSSQALDQLHQTGLDWDHRLDRMGHLAFSWIDRQGQSIQLFVSEIPSRLDAWQRDLLGP